MDHGLDDLSKHNAWANRQLLAFLGSIDSAVMEATVPGTFGSIIATMRHLIDSEMSYLFRLTSAWSERPWPYDEAVGLDVLAKRAAVLQAAWDQYLAGQLDSEKLGEAYGDEGEVFAVRGGVFIAQAFHHANEHRAHICTILGAHGLEPPDVSAWGYAEETGRSWIEKTANGT